MIILLRNEVGYHSPENMAVEVLAPCIFDMIDGVRLLAQMLHVLLGISIKYSSVAEVKSLEPSPVSQFCQPVVRLRIMELTPYQHGHLYGSQSRLSSE